MSVYTLEIPNLNLRTGPLSAAEYDAAVCLAADLLGIIDVEEYSTAGGWRWRLEDPGNHKNLCSPGEDFHDREESRENFRRVYRLLGGQKAIRWNEVEG